MTINSRNRKHGVEYTPSSYLALNWVLRLLPVDHTSWTFVDVGAGRGRVVCAAARLPFKGVIGIDFCEEFCQDARKNVALIPDKEIVTDSISIVHEDITNFTPPPGNCVYYLFNPFNRAVMEPFIRGLVADYEREPRSLLLVYYNPVCADILEQTPEICEIHLPFYTRLKFRLATPHRLKMFHIIRVEGTNRN